MDSRISDVTSLSQELGGAVFSDKVCGKKHDVPGWEEIYSRGRWQDMFFQM